MELDERREADGPSDFLKMDVNAFVGRILMSDIAILNDRHMLNLWRYQGIILNIADISLLLMNTNSRLHFSSALPRLLQTILIIIIV